MGKNISHTQEGGGTNIFHTQGGGQPFSHTQGGTNIFVSYGWGQKFLHQEGGGQTFFVGGGSGYEDVDEEIDVSEANIFVSEASKFSTGARIFRALKF